MIRSGSAGTTPTGSAPSRRGARRGRFAPLAAAGTGVLLVAVSAVLLLQHRSLPADFGAVPDGAQAAARTVAPAASSIPAATASTAATPVPSAARSSSGRPLPALRPVTTPPRVDTTAATTTPARTASPLPTSLTTPTTRPSPTTHESRRNAPIDVRDLPRRLLLPRFGVSADVRTVTSTDGALAVPDDPRQVGWWAGSALPGSATGTTVLDGHIDSATAGVGALIHLSDVAPGDSIQIVGSTGRTLRYVVVARRVYAKNAGLPSALFTSEGPARLLLISCGGPFDAARGSYEDNIVVFATPTAP